MIGNVIFVSIIYLSSWYAKLFVLIMADDTVLSRKIMWLLVIESHHFLFKKWIYIGAVSLRYKKCIDTK